MLVGKDTKAAKFKDATKRNPPVVVLGLRRLQGLLLGHLSFQDLETLPVLTCDMFKGNAYEAAGAPPPRGQAPPAASVSSGKQAAPDQPAKAASAAAKAAPQPDTVKAKPPPAATAASATAGTAAASSSQALVAHAAASSEPSSAVTVHTGQKAKFRIPKPGVGGAIPGVLEGKRFVLTGVFPELGGGKGLTLGKDRTTAMITSFGGRVTSAVSGKTDFVLVRTFI